MDVIQRRHNQSSSTLNPNAPLFVPMAYRMVEDFSDQWWALIQSSPWFREYWLQERYADPQNDSFFADMDDRVSLPDIDDLFDDYDITQEEEGREYGKELVSIGNFKWRKGRVLAQAPKYTEKAPKIVNFKVSPRTIQQPR